MRRLLPRSAGARAILGIVALFVVLNVVAFLVSTVRPEPSGVAGSAYATQPRGVAAYAELLRRSGRDVTFLREPLSAARLDPGVTLVVLDAPPLGARSRAALGRFVRDGGRLVAGGFDAGAGVVPGAPRWVARGPRTARPSAPVPETSAVRSVESSGAGGFDPAGAALPALGGRPALLSVATSGAGRALLLADTAPLQNRLLGRADNAALALALAGPADRRVIFAESVHGFGQATGLAALPSRWRLALAGILLAALLWMLSRARRLGPPEPAGEDQAPARREHVEALALALRRSRDPAAALAPVQAAARMQVIRRAALAPDVPDGALREAALRLGFGEDEAAALTGERGTGDALALGRALARGSSANIASGTNVHGRPTRGRR